MSEYLCKLPFQGDVVISQGRNGPFSHKIYPRIDMSNAVDFSLPIGTSVKCARRGVVEMVFQRNNEYYSGYDPDIGLGVPTNLVIVNHLDGTAGLYSHLGSNRSSLKRKQIVEEGEIISVTGRSGWVPIPHLHFQVCKFDGIRMSASIPISFKDYDGPLDHKDLGLNLR